MLQTCGDLFSFSIFRKVRKEKINAIARQLSNFLIWQTESPTTHHKQQKEYAIVRVVGCPDESTKTLIENRTVENMKRLSNSTKRNDALLPHVTITCETLEQYLKDLAIYRQEGNKQQQQQQQVYLSPDAFEVLDINREPPKIVIVGLLIDRRVKPNRSRDRADLLKIVARRWPLEDCFVGIDANEPLNVDCVLEGMQQWWWNCSNNDGPKESFIQAASQAIEHHAKRHPARPLHIPKKS